MVSKSSQRLMNDEMHSGHKKSIGMNIGCSLLLLLTASLTLVASPATWTFAPSKVGRALHEGGWTVEYSLWQINASPEFSFPLQLIYRNNREQAGMFGSQW